MKVLNISGGGTKIVGEYGAIETLYKSGWKPDVITGISAGAILALLSAMNLIENEEIKNKFLNLKISDFFKTSPINKKGNISLSAIWRFITCKNSLGDFSNLKKLLKEFICEDTFNKWQQDNNSAAIYVGSVSYTTGQRVYWDIKALSFDEALNAVVASASIPVFCQPVKMFHKEENTYHYHFDGGVRDFIGSEFSANKYSTEIDEMINIYSKPLNNEIFNFDHTRTNKLLSIFNSTLDILMIEVSKSDETITKLLSEKYKFKYSDIYIPNNLEGPYDTDPSRLRDLYIEGKTTILNYLNP